MLKEEIENLIEGEVSAKEADLKFFSHDASIFEVRPQVVVRPKNTEDLKKLVSFVSEKKSSQPDLSLTARAAGSDMTGGPLNESIILDFTAHFNKIYEITDTPDGGGYAILEPGVYYRDFEKEAARKNLLFPSYPASKSLCALGGMVANNAGGEKSLSYGKTEKYVRELNVVLSDGNEYILGPLTSEQLEQKKSQQNFEGEIYRRIHELISSNTGIIKDAKPDVSKNSAGYYLWNVWDGQKFDLTQLFVGSQGTLGLITKIKIGLIHPKKHSKLLIMFLRDLAPLGNLVNEVMKFKPESFESYDDQTLKLAIRFFPDLLKKMKGNAILLFFRFIPEAMMILTGGMPKFVLIAEFTGDDEKEVDRKLEEAQSQVRSKFHIKTRVARTAAEAEKYWTIRRESFSLLRKHVGDKHTAPFIDDVVVHIEQLPKFLPKLNELVGQYKGLTYTIAGHAGDANFHVIPLMDFRKEENRKAIPELSEKVYDLVASLRGSITGEHNDGLIRTPYLNKMFKPEVIALFEKTKSIFDPLNIFNPGKKVGGSLNYSLDHIRKTYE
ncbi:MAG: FAD-binding oxidoreductase [Candidatus Paceibacterota bacterium]